MSTEHGQVMEWHTKYETMPQKQDQNMHVIEDLLRRISRLEQKSAINIDYIDDN